MHKAARHSDGVDSSNPCRWRGKRLHHHGGGVCWLFVLLWMDSWHHELIICKKWYKNNLKMRLMCYFLIHVGVHHTIVWYLHGKIQTVCIFWHTNVTACGINIYKNCRMCIIYEMQNYMMVRNQIKDVVFVKFFLRGGKTHCALIATPNVDNANRRQKKGKS